MAAAVPGGRPAGRGGRYPSGGPAGGAAWRAAPAGASVVVAASPARWRSRGGVPAGASRGNGGARRLPFKVAASGGIGRRGARVRLRRDAPLPPRASEQAGSIRVPSKRGGRGRRGRARPCLRAKTVPSPGAWAGSEASKVRFPGRSGARAPRPCRSGFFLSTPPPTFSVCARTVSRGEALVVPSVRAPGVGRAGGRRAGPSSEKRGRSWRAVPALPRARGRCRKADNS